MWGHGMRRILSCVVPAVLVISVGSCVDEKIVYRDGPTFVTPPSNAASFLGYSDQASKRTVCGSCHIGQQARWQETAHADAFATLENSGHMQGTCQRCHTVNNQGNAVTDTTAGWRSTTDARYHDVQCESCHGPGLPHVTSPQRGQMLASIHADTGAGVTNGCAECHSGTHHPFVEEWKMSAHGNPPTHQYDAAGPRAACQGCHIGQFVLAAWGVNTNYTEKTAGQSAATGEPITCAVCHDSHGSPYGKQLRYPVDASDPENNLCAKCHSQRSTPDWSSSRGDAPHAPHGPLVFGTAGWWPPNVDFIESQSTHGSEANPRLCATCHVQNYAVTDQETGAFQVQVVGHRFLAIPCVDANGNPTEVQKLPPDDTPACTVTQRSFKGCASSTCHGNNEANARNAFTTATNDVGGLVQLLDLMIAQVPASEFGAGKVNAGRGAKFNSEMAKMPGAQVHNPVLVKALLRYSGVALNDTYGIPLPPGLAPTAVEAALVRVKSSQ